MRLLVVEDDAGAARAATDPDRLERIVSNLLSNALRHARSQVRVDVSTVDGNAALVVADDGPGFPEDFLARAFDRFSQSDPSRTRTAAAAEVSAWPSSRPCARRWEQP